MGHPPRRIIRSTVVFVTGFVIFAAILDVTLRFGLGLGNPVLIAEDLACGYTLKPDQDIFRFFAHTHINHYGMRSDEVPAVRAPHAWRIMFVGDSITYGTTRVDQSRIFPELLHRQLPSILKRPVEVLNASANAWAMDNELSYLRSRGTFQSDQILLVLNSGDLTQSRSTMAEVGEDLPRERPGSAFGEIFTRYIKPRIFHAARRADAGDSPSADAAGIVQAANLANLDKFHSLASSQHARFAIVYLPFRRDIPDVSSLSLETLRMWSGKNQVPLIDLTSIEAAYTAKEITLDNGVHLNASGHSLVAERIKERWPAVLAQP